MKLAVLFWCYKEPELCLDRVLLLRRHDARTPIYVLFGGEPDAAPAFEALLAPHVQDFWVCREPPPAGAERYPALFRGGRTWKYVYGDVLLAAWQRERGHALAWDTLVVVQWDMLVFAPIPELFGFLREGEALFSGLRPLAEVEEAWIWTSRARPAQRRLYEDFVAHLRERYGYRDEPLACLAIVMALPRTFLERFAAFERLDLGFLEYRLPMVAQAFGVPLRREHPFRPWWGAVERYRLLAPLRALPREIWVPTIVWNLLRPGGARVFHPYWRKVPRGALGWGLALADSVPRLVRAALRGARLRLAARRGRGRDPFDPDGAREA